MRLWEALVSEVKDAFSFTGRMSRLPYIIRNGTLNLLLWVTFTAFVATSSQGLGSIALAVILFIFFSLLIMQLGYQVKRLHDMNLSGKHLLWVYIVLVVASLNPVSDLIAGLSFFVIMSFIKGTEGENRFDKKN